MKNIVIMLITLVIVFSYCFKIFADDTISIYINNQKLETDVIPENKEGSIMLPFRVILNGLGITDDKINWNDEKRSVEVRADDKYIFFIVGNKTAVANGNVIELACEVYVKEGRTMVPVRFISEALGAKIKWEGSEKSVKITN